MAEPEDLVGSFVVEVGVRQAWPYLTFCDNRPTPSVERRLYIESAIEVTPPGDIVPYGSMSAQWQALSDLDGLVRAVKVNSKGDLRLEFEEGEALVVFRDQVHQDPSMAPWWIGQL